MKRLLLTLVLVVIATTFAFSQNTGKSWTATPSDGYFKANIVCIPSLSTPSNSTAATAIDLGNFFVGIEEDYTVTGATKPTTSWTIGGPSVGTYSIGFSVTPTNCSLEDEFLNGTTAVTTPVTGTGTDLGIDCGASTPTTYGLTYNIKKFTGTAEGAASVKVTVTLAVTL